MVKRTIRKLPRSREYVSRMYLFTYARPAVIARSQSTKQSFILLSQINEIASLRSQ
jgi:hypothetical protein